MASEQTAPTSEPTLAQLLDAFEEASNQCGLDSYDHERGGISYAEWQRSVQKEEVARKALTAHVDALRTALANAERERDALQRTVDQMNKSVAFWENYATPEEIPFLRKLRSLTPENQAALYRYGQTLAAALTTPTREGSTDA